MKTTEHSIPQSSMQLSIIIPTLNESGTIHSLLMILTNHENSNQIEIIVVDGGSEDGTQEQVGAFAQVKLIRSPIRSRASQMNLGAAQASGDVLYFVHADVLLPESFYEDIRGALAKSSHGGYRYKFDSSKFVLRINAFFTRFTMEWCQGGDQTLFITRALFDHLGGYDEYYCIMEDYDLLRRASHYDKYRVIPKSIMVSARKYDHNGYFKVQRANLSAFRMFKRGVNPKKIRTCYKLALGLKDY